MTTLEQKNIIKFYDDKSIDKNIKELNEKSTGMEFINHVIKLKMSYKSNNNNIDNMFNKLLIVKAGTGSGKSTYMVYGIFEAVGRNIACTQPRINLTLSNALEIIRYRGNTIKMGYNIGVENSSMKIKPTNKRKNILYITTQIMTDYLANILNETNVADVCNKLSKYKVIIVDECHVTDLPMLGMLYNIKLVLNKYHYLKQCPLFVLSSATLNDKMLARFFFGDAYKDFLTDYRCAVYIDKVSKNKVVKNVYLTNNDIKSIPYIETTIDERKIIKENNKKVIKNIQKKIKIPDVIKYVFEYYTKRIFPEQMKLKNIINVKIDNKEIEVDARDCAIFLTSIFQINNLILLLNSFFKNKNIPYLISDFKTSIDNYNEWTTKNRNKKRLVIIGYARDYSILSNDILSVSISNDLEKVENEIKIILTTPILDTGKTITTLYYVIDIGIQLYVLRNPLIKSNTRVIVTTIPISKTVLKQREGRVGREGPGEFHHLYTEEITDKLIIFDYSEIELLSCLTNYLLKYLEKNKIFDIYDYDKFLFKIPINTLINTSYDMYNSSYISKFGYIYEYNNTTIWIMYAKYLYYNGILPLWKALLISLFNQNVFINSTSIYKTPYTSLPIKLTNLHSLNSDMLNSVIIKCRKEYLNIKFNKSIIHIIDNNIF